MRIRPIHMRTARIHMDMELILMRIRTLMVTVIPATMEATTATHTVTVIGAAGIGEAVGVTTAVVATLGVVMPDVDMLAADMPDVALREVALEAAAN
jgi:hypothetical protein